MPVLTVKHPEHEFVHTDAPHAAEATGGGLLTHTGTPSSWMLANNHNVNAVLVRVAEGRSPEVVAADIRRWKHVQAFTRAQMEDILIAKLIGMILQQALGLGVIGFAVGKISATLWGPAFPRYVLLEPWDAVIGFVIVMLVCVLASTLAIRAALRVDPAAAIGG